MMVDNTKRFVMDGNLAMKDMKNSSPEVKYSNLSTGHYGVNTLGLTNTSTVIYHGI